MRRQANKKWSPPDKDEALKQFKRQDVRKQAYAVGYFAIRDDIEEILNAFGLVFNAGCLVDMETGEVLVDDVNLEEDNWSAVIAKHATQQELVDAFADIVDAYPEWYADLSFKVVDWR